MRTVIVARPVALLVNGLSLPGQIRAQEPLGISGEWKGAAVNSEGGFNPNDTLTIREHADGTLTGLWTSLDLKIEKGQRVTGEVVRWESTDARGGQWRATCTQRGKSLVIDWTTTTREFGKVRGLTGTSILVRK